MPAVNGFFARSSDAGYLDPGYISDDLDAYSEAWINNIASHATTRSPGTAPYTSMLPVEANGAPRVGFVAATYSDDLYHRIHVVPLQVDVGNVVTKTTRTVYVWNAHFASKLLSAITASGTLDGLTLGDEPNPPLVYSPLQERDYLLTADVSGDSTIEARFVFEFPGEHPGFTVTGERVTIFPFQPDWSKSPVERYAWATSILTHADGTEQRIRLRQHARRGVEFSLLALGDQARRLETVLFGCAGRKVLVPIWWDAELSQANISAGSTTVTVTDISLKDYYVGGYVVLWKDGNGEAGEISAIVGNTLSLRAALSRSWPAGSKIMPGVVAMIENDGIVTRVSDSVAIADLRFAVDESTPDRPPQEIGQSFAAYSVLNETPDWGGDVREEWARTWDVLDTLTGKVLWRDRTGSPILRRSYTWLINGKQAIDRWKRWASARAGRLNPLWLPSFCSDLILKASAGSSDDFLTVESTLAGRYIGNHRLRPAVRIELANGQVLHRGVVGVEEVDDTTEKVKLDASLGISFSPSHVRRIMWMMLARLEADTVEFVYETDAIAVLKVSFRGVMQ